MSFKQMKIKYLSILSCFIGLSTSAADNPHLGPDVVPFVKQYCLDCHNDDKEKGDRSFEAFLQNPEDPNELFTLEEIVDLLNLGDMPPDEDDVLQPPSEERHKAVDSITEYLLAVEENRAPSETVLRRLTRYEYNNSMRDLLGVNPDIADATTQFPIDQEKHGFTNIGEAQVLSQHQLALYLKAARIYLDQALVFGKERPERKPGYLSLKISLNRPEEMLRLNTACWMNQETFLTLRTVNQQIEEPILRWIL